MQGPEVECEQHPLPAVKREEDSFDTIALRNMANRGEKARQF